MMRYKEMLIAALAVSLLMTGCRNKNSSTSNKSQESDTTALERPRQQGSIYQIDMDFVNQDGKAVPWRSLQGKVQVMAMVFTHCQYACPRITQDIKNIQKLIPPQDTAKVGFTLISFDVARDTPARLKAFAKERGLDSHWQLLHGSTDDVQTVSALLDVKFKPMEDSLFSHQNIISVVKPNGEVAYRQEGLGRDPKALAEKVRELAEH